MDHFIVTWLQKIVGHKTLPARLLTGMARYGFIVFILYGIAAWFCPGRRRQVYERRKSLCLSLFTVILSSLLSWLIGKVWPRPRPFSAHADVGQHIRHKANASFPSNHAMNGFAAALSVGSFAFLHGLFLFIWNCIMGIGRVYAGIHYLTDLLGGLVLSLVSWRIVKHSHFFDRLADLLLDIWKVMRMAIKIIWYTEK